MKEQGNTIKSLLVAIGVFTALGLGGYLYITRDTAPADDLLVGKAVGGSSTVDGDLLVALRDLKTISFNNTIFTNPVFRSLHDFSQTLTEQPAERQNPFAPINPSEANLPVASQTNAQIVAPTNLFNISTTSASSQ